MAAGQEPGRVEIVGDGIVGYGCPPMSPVAAGLIHMELNRGDGSLGTFHAVQAGLAMRSIWMLGSEEQKDALAARRWPGWTCSGRSPSPRRRTGRTPSRWRHATPDGDVAASTGEKRWIGNGTIADVVVVWARDTADGQVKGFLVEKGAPGYDATVIDGKGSVRAVLAGRHHPDGVRVPDRDGCPGRAASRTPVGCSPPPGSRCAWGALGHAVAAYEAALRYTKQRTQFGKPLVGLPAGPGPAGEDARRGHRHAALLPADRAGWRSRAS